VAHQVCVLSGKYLTVPAYRSDTLGVSGCVLVVDEDVLLFKVFACQLLWLHVGYYIRM
jgi:hypothetical protein